VDHVWVTQSTMDWRQHGQKGDGAQWRAHRSQSSGHSSEGATERGERREPVSGHTGAQAVVWRLGDDGEEAAVELDGGGA
jgi:hypothetical protein